MHKATRIEKTKEETTATVYWKLEADGCVVMDFADVNNEPVYVTESKSQELVATDISRS